MQPVVDPLNVLSECFLKTLQPEPETRKQAEAFLKAQSNQPGFGINILSLIDSPAAPESIRQAAAVNFKNFIKYHWEVSESDAAAGVVPVQDEERAKIKEHIVELMLRAPPKIQAQISEALSIISSHDFPAKWLDLLPQLVAKMGAAMAQAPGSLDLAVLTGVLQTANSIFKRFRHAMKSETLWTELKYCLDGFVPPLLEVLRALGEMVGQCAAAASGPEASVDPQVKATLLALVQGQRLVCRIFFSLNWQELPEVFEDHLTTWMGEFHQYLTYDFPALVETDTEKEGALDQLKAAVCENINLYMEKNEEEFQPFLPTFVTDVWGLLVGLSLTPLGLSHGRDPLAIMALKFLTTVSRSVHHALFQEAETLRKICESIIVPNIRFRDEDEEIFEMNYMEYIRRDMEGSDSDTRRRMACELVRGLSVNYEQQVTQLFSQFVTAELAQYAADPEGNWKSKDAAIFLIVALAVRQKTAAAGATSTNNLVNLGDFFTAQILLELRAQDVNSQPVIKADALKFLTTFRSQIPSEASKELLPHLIRFLGSESNVVHSYAAHAIERLLVLKDGPHFRLSEAEVASFAQPLLGALFNALKMPESQENQYVMKCIMRVLSRGTPPVPVAAQCCQMLSEALAAVCKNPTSPSFNHYLFEALAALVRRTLQADPSQAPVFEAALFPIMQTVLEQDVQEFSPYVFQILAMLVEMRPPPLPPAYMAVFPALISPTLWERPANVPALVRLLQAYLQKAAAEVVANKQVEPVLGVFQRLIASKHTDHHGFFILNTVMEYLDYANLQPYINTIWTLLFLRLQKSKTPKFVKSLIIFMSLFAALRGPGPLAESIEAVQPGLFAQITGSVWAPNLHSITGKLETKLCTVAAADVLCQSPALQADGGIASWCKLLDAVVTLVTRSEEERAGDEEGDVAEPEEIQSGYSTVYAQLHNAGKVEEDPVRGKTNDACQYLTSMLGQLCARSPGRYPGLISSQVSAQNQAALAQLCAKYHVALA